MMRLQEGVGLLVLQSRTKRSSPSLPTDHGSRVLEFCLPHLVFKSRVHQHWTAAMSTGLIFACYGRQPARRKYCKIVASAVRSPCLNFVARKCHALPRSISLRPSKPCLVTHNELSSFQMNRRTQFLHPSQSHSSLRQMLLRCQSQARPHPTIERNFRLGGAVAPAIWLCDSTLLGYSAGKATPKHTSTDSSPHVASSRKVPEGGRGELARLVQRTHSIKHSARRES